MFVKVWKYLKKKANRHIIDSLESSSSESDDSDDSDEE